MSSSGSTGSGSTGSGSTGSGSTGSGATGSGGTDVSSLTSALKGLQNSGPVDLKLSSETEQAYLNIVSTFRNALNDQLKTITGMSSLGSPGTLPSATQTKNNLELDISGLSGIEQSINQYLSYLDQFSATVKAASNRLIGSG